MQMSSHWHKLLTLNPIRSKLGFVRFRSAVHFILSPEFPFLDSSGNSETYPSAVLHFIRSIQHCSGQLKTIHISSIHFQTFQPPLAGHMRGKGTGLVTRSIKLLGKLRVCKTISGNTKQSY